MQYRFARRMTCAPPSFLDRLFAVSKDPGIISFAGGLPGTRFIDAGGIREAAARVLAEDGRDALQYSTTDGCLSLREYISRRYRQRLGLSIPPEQIQIVNGSQQCLDLVAKIFLDRGDTVAMERPGYLGAIEAFSLYEPVFSDVALGPLGPDIDEFSRVIRDARPKFFYGIPNSQNPSGQTYSREARRAVAEVIRDSDTVFYEDDAFGELFFDGKPRPPVAGLVPGQAVLSGSFSKIIAPGMRIGWICAPPEVLGRFNCAKQAADLHSNFLCQKILSAYLETHDLDAHVRRIARAYGENCRLMCEILDEDFPPDISHTEPGGGMFLMVSLPPGLHSHRLFEEGLRKGVAVLPGTPFYACGGGESAVRLNFSSMEEEQIKVGMERLAGVVRALSP
ncbi:MAG: PLP-dependent aminotransferase family protein [Methanolinea sp.]|nr:PLP-dependent aminotransferase family protein [Methanolinea sp.]